MAASSPPSSSPLERIRGTVPKLVDLTEKVVFGDVWERPELSKRDRSLITCAALVALQRPDQLRAHLGRAARKRRDQGRVGRTYHPPCFLHVMADFGHCGQQRQGSLRQTAVERRGRSEP